MQLSRNFTLEELTATTTGFLNRPDSDEINRLAELALHILQPIRERWGRIRITSGFRSP
ncbi:MAG: peptidase M15, partial [Deltaproteobacteria bacterium]|nr:peptidase M15 [Deltaproteobacteria bacterium]